MDHKQQAGFGDARPAPGTACLLGDALFAQFLERLDEPGDLVPGPLENALTRSSDSSGASASELLERIGKRGARVERYSIRSQLGEGGMGVVYEVWDDELHRSLAMKKVRLEGVSEERACSLLTRFLEEAQISAQLDHPGILPVHELGLDQDGTVFFTMQLVRGHDLAQGLERATQGDSEWSRSRLLGVLQRVCEALGYAHSQGVIHRDLKPQNIMVGRFGEVYVMDWGLAKVLGSEVQAQEPIQTHSRSPGLPSRRDLELDSSLTPLTEDGDVLGTPAYMPLEQAQGRIAALDRRSDVYSLGCLLYQILTGFAPYGEGGRRLAARAVLMRVLDGPPLRIDAVAPDVPAELVAICEKAMERDPAARYVDVEALAGDLRAFLEGRVVAAHESGALAELRKWVSRNRTVAGISAMLLVTLVAGVVTSSLLYSKSERTLQDLQRGMVSTYQGQLVALFDEARHSYPVVPDRIGEYEAWIAATVKLTANVENLSATLLDLGLAPGEREDLAVLRESAKRLHDPLVGPLDGFSLESGVGMRERLALARHSDELQSGLYSAPWREALESIADRDQCPQYAGLQFTQLPGLVPIGRDRVSKLWEFADVRTGTVPVRSDATGALEFGSETALVFVLIPPGTDTIGLQSPEDLEAITEPVEAGMNFKENNFLRSEAPAVELRFDPFLLSKYEITQAQWMRIAHANPSRRQPGEVVGGSTITDTHPVEQVSWEYASDVLAWFGWGLPTEACWEYAARAGSDTLWWTGPTRASIAGQLNLADLSAARAGEDWRSIREDLEDGWVRHAPVDSLAANGFGLHHILGNVNEWCLDRFVSQYLNPHWGENNERLDAPVGSGVGHSMRGGNFTSAAVWARSSSRKGIAAGSGASTTGIRPAIYFAR